MFHDYSANSAKCCGVQKSASVQGNSECLQFMNGKYLTCYFQVNIFFGGRRKKPNFTGEMLFPGLFETLPGRVQCEMLLKVTEQCFNTLERSEMLLLLLRRFPETVVQHGVGLTRPFSLRKDCNCFSFDALALVTHL